MAKRKLTKAVVEAAQPSGREQELRDTLVPGFLCKVTPTGRKVFMVQYRTNDGTRRKPAIGAFGELTVDQARTIAQRWLAEVRNGGDPSAEKAAARDAPTVKQLAKRFMDEYSRPRNKPKTVESNVGYIDLHILPTLGNRKVPEVTRADILDLMKRLEHKQVTANRVLSCLRKMFNLSEVWGYRPDGSNPCRHVPKYKENGTTRYITDEELGKLFAYLGRAEVEGLEHPTLLLAIRLQFEFAARMSEILNLRWDWVDLANRRVAWPDSKTDRISKPISEEGYRLLSSAYRFAGSPYVCPAIFDPQSRLPNDTYYHGWMRVLQRAGVPHVGTHGIRHRAATDIANSGVPVKVGMALTAHKTVTMFMRYVHTEDDPVRAAAETVTVRRRGVVDAVQSQHQLLPAADREPMKVGGGRRARSAVGNYRPFRRRNGPNRAVPKPLGAIGPIAEESGFADRQTGTVIRSEADEAA